MEILFLGLLILGLLVVFGIDTFQKGIGFGITRTSKYQKEQRCHYGVLGPI